MQLSLKNITDIKFIIISTLLILLLLLIIFSPWIAPFNPHAQNLNNALLPPNSIHILGTDRYGRDLFSRILVGGQLTYIFFIISSSYYHHYWHYYWWYLRLFWW